MPAPRTDWHYLTRLHVTAPGGGQVGPRRGEPVTVGVPFPRGAVTNAAALTVRDADGETIPLQVRALDRWSDGSLRWGLLDFRVAASTGADAAYLLGLTDASSAPETAPGPPVTVTREGHHLLAEAGFLRVEAAPGGPLVFSASHRQDGAIPVAVASLLEIRDARDVAWAFNLDTADLEEEGPLRAVLRLVGRARRGRSGPDLLVMLRLHVYPGLPVLKAELTIRNPRRARHAGGLWELGDPGSIHLRDATFTVRLSGGGRPDRVVTCSPERGSPLEACGRFAEVYQDSSGRPNWQSANHVNRRGEVPVRFRGYSFKREGSETAGDCATPVVTVGDVSLASPEFWENWPKAMEATAEAISFRLFPRQYADVHELQGGEQKTHVFWLAVGRDGITDVPLDWCRSPLLASAEPDWYAGSTALGFLPRARDLDPRYLSLTRQAVEGESSFERKRDVIDEYGWRHYGEIYADHEAVYHAGATPLVSHYNNQYDAAAGLAYHFMMSGDACWWPPMDSLARHVVDIDVYHTHEDKAAFNGGLFWHTFHYTDAGRSTHRSYPHATGIIGGGPSNEHDYSTGLMLHYFLTGSPDSREAVLGLARWVIDMDDGRKTIFRWLDRGLTGLASASAMPDFHGPGRGAANSIQTLLNAFRLAGDEAYLRKAEELICRCVHPDDDLEALDLLDAERRWHYTVFLEVLGRYLWEQAERKATGQMYAYARASLLHYARWMVEHEHPYLEKPEILEYPNETWPAQDMRKAEVLDLASLLVTGPERARFRERSRFFFDYSVSTLLTMPTRTLTRPTVLMLSHGFAHAWFGEHPDASLPAPQAPVADFGRPRRFVPQKFRAIRRAKLLVAAAGVGIVAAALAIATALLR